jgi:hypothetical protein
MAAADKKQVFLEGDDEIRGQKFVCLSFLTPDKALLKNKNVFFFSKFLEFYALDYKIKTTESYIMKQLRDVQNTLADVELSLENDAASSPPATLLKELSAKVSKTRETLAKQTMSDLEEHVKENMGDFKDSTIQEAYDRYMLVHQQKLEDEFHKANNFQTTMNGLKIRGVYGTNEQAVMRAKALSKKDPYFNVYVAEVGEWLPWDPVADEIQDQEYQNEQLNTLMKTYKENAAKKDAFFEEEKRKIMTEAAAVAEAAKKKLAESDEKETPSEKTEKAEETRTGPVFGSKGKELDAAELGREIFDGVDADLALARKAAEQKEREQKERDTETIQYA